jgi:hypothetical protein
MMPWPSWVVVELLMTPDHILMKHGKTMTFLKEGNNKGSANRG